MPSEYPEGEQVFVGRRGMAEVIALLRDSWTTWRFEAEEFIETGHCVVALIRVAAEGGTAAWHWSRRPPMCGLPAKAGWRRSRSTATGLRPWKPSGSRRAPPTLTTAEPARHGHRWVRRRAACPGPAS